jgi:hypothetical protein
MKNSNSRINRRVRQKRFFRKVRSKLKKKIRNGGVLSKATIRIYNLQRNRYWKQERAFESFIIEIPEHFCFLSDHESTIKFLRNLKDNLKKLGPRSLFISHENTKVIGLSASFSFDYEIENYLQKWKSRKLKLNISGKISQDREVNNFLLAFGLFKMLRIKPSKSSKMYDLDYLDKYISYKNDSSVEIVDKKAQASIGLTDYFDKCLRLNGKVIETKVRATLIDAFGELLGNAEEHCGETSPRWFVRGCYEKHSHYCKFAIINYGISIYESMSREGSTCSKSVSMFVKKWKKRTSGVKENIMSILNKNPNMEPLWNLMAIQEGISSKRTAFGSKGSTRGHGLMDVIEYISSIKDDKGVAEIAIISGGSKILIDFSYPIAKINIGQE